jgi:hypothetical protein
VAMVKRYVKLGLRVHGAEYCCATVTCFN